MATFKHIGLKDNAIERIGFTYNGETIAYSMSGEGRDLLFMHGLGADSSQSHQLLADLPGYRLITLDMPGHGDSILSKATTVERQAGFIPYANVAHALLDHLDVGRAILGGISMGAGIALRMAVDAPATTEALILVRPAWLDQSGRPQLDIIADIGDWTASDGIAFAQERLEENAVYAEARKSNPACAASIFNATKRTQAESAAAVLRAVVEDQPLERLAMLDACTAPALVVGNNADPLHPAMIARTLANVLPNAEYFHAPPKYLAGKDHQIDVRRKIKSFLDEHSGTPYAPLHDPILEENLP